MSADWVGTTLNGRYQILEVLGSGGMSTVFKANDLNLQRVVAVKVVHAHLSSDEEFMRRFQSEATAVAQLRHPHIVGVYDFDSVQGVAYIVFEFVAGENLQEHLTRLAADGRRMPAETAVQIGAQMADALGYAHARSMIHRDVKPANILLDVHGTAYLTDFGIVKMVGGMDHTATGAVVGTAKYMSPEQIRGEQLDGRSDLYSLGIVLYEMTSGRPPYEADSAMTLMMMHVNDPVPDCTAAGISSPLAPVIQRALAKDPAQRYQTGEELAAALRAVDLSAPAAAAVPAAGAATIASGPPPGPPPTPQPDGGGRRAWPWVLAAGVLVILLGVAAALVLTSDGGGDTTETAATGEQPTESSTTTEAPAESSTTTEAPAESSTSTSVAGDAPETVAITGITEEGGRYFVDYETTGYTEALPGEHVHFYWNDIDESQAGVGPDEAEWFVWGGPRPFNGYTVDERPSGATQICAVVANPDHTIKPGTGNCWDLP